ncbi:hypothetical protein AX16_004902 [Volvariella volvacea WC 439]|nr:hypothetical protein AX16_004902 [Volvariella volvacea WC 439]
MASSDTSSPSIYNQLAELPAPISAEFLGSDVIQVKSAIKNHTQNIKRTYSKYIFLQSSSADPKATPKPIFSTPYEEVSARIVAESWSPSKRWKILLVSDGGKENQKRRIEVWKYEKAGDGKGLSSGKLHIELDVTKRHGAFYADGK